MSDGFDVAATQGDAIVPPPSTREKRIEIAVVILLAFAALATAWSGYQASLWDGIQSSNYTQVRQHSRTRRNSISPPTSTGSSTSPSSRTTSTP